MDIWKFTDSLPCSSTEGLSSFLIIQKMSGPRTLPNGMPTNPASAIKWQSASHVLFCRMSGGSKFVSIYNPEHTRLAPWNYNFVLRLERAQAASFAYRAGTKKARGV